MCRIVPVEPVGIAKDGCRFFERHAMFLKIGDRLRNVPRKHQDVYTVINFLIQSISQLNPHVPQPLCPSAFVVRHAITAALRGMNEAKMNGAPGNSMDLLRLESDRMK